MRDHRNRTKAVENIRERFVTLGLEITLEGQARLKPPCPKLDTYAEPYDSKYPKLCMDEQPIQLLKETRAPDGRRSTGRSRSRQWSPQPLKAA